MRPKITLRTFGAILATSALFLGCADADVQPTRAEGDSALLVVIDTIGTESDAVDSMDAVIGNIVAADVNRITGAVYIADARAMGVHEFSSEGRFVRTIGSPGEGPGEFSDLTTIASGPSGLVVFDWMRRRVSAFDAEGELRATYRLVGDSLYWPRSAVALDDSSFVLLFKHELGEDLLHFVHMRGVSLESDHRQSWAPVREVYGDLESRFVHLRSEFTPGSLTLLDDGSVVFAPHLYDGVLYQYAMRSGTWTLKSEIKVRTFENESYEEVGSEPFPPEANVIYGQTTVAGIIRRQSAGLARADSVHLLHFVFERSETNAQSISVEIIDLSSFESRHVPFLILDSDATYSRSPWFVVGSDDVGRIYAADLRREPSIQVLRFNDALILH